MATLSAILIICPQFMGALLPEALATYLHKKEVTVWMMSCGALVSIPESYTQLAAEVEHQVASLVLPGEAESTYFFSDCLRFDCINCSSAPALSDSRLHPCLCTASFG